MLDVNAIDTAGTARADRDDTNLKTILGIDTGTTFFPHGTSVLQCARDLARRDRATFMALPTVEAGMTSLIDAVHAEDRRDHTADIGDGHCDFRGLLTGWKDADGADVGYLAPSEVGWSRLANFAPADVPTGLRTNVNAWLGRRRGDKVVLRTRRARTGAERELYACVSTGYVPFDLDKVAETIREVMPADARVRVRYDGRRSRVDVVLHNPHEFNAPGAPKKSAGTVGELHRLMLRVTTADDGTGGFKLRWGAERIRCINLTLLRGQKVVFNARHTQKDLADQAVAALAAQGAAMEEFARVWRDAWTSYYVDNMPTGAPLAGDEALKRLAFHGAVRIPGIRGADATYDALAAALAKEPGDSSAHVYNAITRAAHEAPTTWKASSWADDDTEEQASELLYARRILAPIPDEDRAELAW